MKEGKEQLDLLKPTDAEFETKIHYIKESKKVILLLIKHI